MPRAPSVDRVAIIGLGLIGSSIARAIRERLPRVAVTGHDASDDVRDVARGHLLAAERGLAGERYLLGARNMTLQEILAMIGSLSGRKPPRVRLPYAVAYGFAALETGLSRVTGREPRAPLEAVRMARKKMFVSCEKAEAELKFRPGSVQGALRRAIEWFQKNGYC